MKMTNNDEIILINQEISEKDKKELLNMNTGILTYLDKNPGIIIKGEQLVKEFYELLCEEVKKSRDNFLKETNANEKMRYSGRMQGLELMKQAYEVVFENFLDLPQVDSKTRKNIDKIMENLRNGKNKN